MSWLRIDDRFDRHLNWISLSDREFRIWIGVLCYCAEYETDGYLPTEIAEVVPGAKRPYLERCVALRLLDVVGDRLRVHDWRKYQPVDKTKAERQARWRKRRRDQGDVDDEGDADVDGGRDGGKPPGGDGSDDAEETVGTVYRDSASRAGPRARPRPRPKVKNKTPEPEPVPSRVRVREADVPATHGTGPAPGVESLAGTLSETLDQARPG